MNNAQMVVLVTLLGVLTGDTLGTIWVIRLERKWKKK